MTINTTTRTRTFESEMKVTTFNTGRGYTAEGQRIAYTTIAKEPHPILEDDSFYTISFADFDRNLDGTVKCLSEHDREPTPSEVLKMYDHGGYGYDTDRARVDQLRAAAKHHNKQTRSPAPTEDEWQDFIKSL